LALPSVDVDLDTLEKEHLLPFRVAIEAGVGALMTAHVRYRALDDAPATTSRRILTDLARGELGYDGVIVTDSLGMGAISAGGGMAVGAIRALAAGADLLCVSAPLDRQLQVAAAIEQAVVTGEVTRRRLDEANRRVRQLAERAVPLPGGTGPVGEGRIGLDAARRALRTYPLPPPVSSAPYVLEISTARTGVDEVRTRLIPALQTLAPATVGRAVARDALPGASEVLAAAGTRPLVIVTRDASRREGQAQLVESLLKARPDSVLVGLGGTLDAQLAPGRFVPARGSAPPNLQAAAEVIVGRRAADDPGARHRGAEW
ncbi:MAG TPA: glycoside hydrolase family 3 N-terminal domain-containing protein, partial [Acidimicrobiales bacterium]